MLSSLACCLQLCHMKGISASLFSSLKVLALSREASLSLGRNEKDTCHTGLMTVSGRLDDSSLGCVEATQPLCFRLCSKVGFASQAVVPSCHSLEFIMGLSSFLFSLGEWKAALGGNSESALLELGR